MSIGVKMLSPSTECDDLQVVAPELGGAYLIDAATIDDTGAVAFIGAVAGSSENSAVFLQTSEGTRPLIKAGDRAPGGGKYEQFLELDLAHFIWQGVERTFLVFRAKLEGSRPHEGIFLWSSLDTTEVIALTGTTSLRGATYRSFSQPTITAASGNGTVSYFLAFIAVTAEGNKLLIQKSSHSDLEEVLATGATVGNGVVGNFVMSRMGAFVVSCVAEIRHNGKGKPFNEVLIVGPGYVIAGGTLREGTNFEGTGRVKRILAPPTVAFQVSFVAVEFKNQLSAIVARDVFGLPGLVAKTGEPIRGSVDETIQSFGPPITNARIPISGPQAIVSRVRLSSGRSALWSHVFKFGGANEAETKLLFTEGTHNELSSVVPLKVNNHGALLLRATIGEGTSAREGVFVMNGLFD